MQADSPAGTLITEGMPSSSSAENRYNLIMVFLRCSSPKVPSFNLHVIFSLFSLSTIEFSSQFGVFSSLHYLSHSVDLLITTYSCVEITCRYVYFLSFINDYKNSVSEIDLNCFL